MLKTFKTVLAAIMLLGLTSCVSLNAHQSGRTIGKDNYSLFGNFNYGHLDSELYSVEDSGLFHIAEIGILHGIKENLDVGFKANTSFHFTGTSKLQFIGDKQSFFASSLGLDLGAAPFGLTMGAMSYSGSFSLYNSIHPTDYLALTFSPKYTYLGFTNFTKEYRFTREDNIYGYSSGFIIGKKHQFSFEISQYVDNTKFSFATKPILSFGYIWNTGKIRPTIPIPGQRLLKRLGFDPCLLR